MSTMKGALRRGVALGILLGLTNPARVTSAQQSASHDTEASHILTSQAANDLFSALNLARPELASVAVAWKRKRYSARREGTPQYFRTRTAVGWRSQTADAPPLSPQSRAIADAAVEGKLQGGYTPLVYSFPHGNIDWHFNPTYHTPVRLPTMNGNGS